MNRVKPRDKNGVEIEVGDILKETFKAGWCEYEVCFGKYDNGEHYEDHESGFGYYMKELRDCYGGKVREKQGEIRGFGVYPDYRCMEIVSND